VVGDNKPNCKKCAEGAICLGKDKIGPSKNYWRVNSNSEGFISCYNYQACPGATND